MNPVLTVSFPKLSASDQREWAAFKRDNSPAARVDADLHVTLVFATAVLPLRDYTAHISSVAHQTQPVEFVCRYAMLGVDDEDTRAYVFLVPDEGYSGISLLHDALYKGPLASALRLDLPYVPHITVATLDDREQAKSLCDELNDRGVWVEGSLTKLSIGEIVDGRYSQLSEQSLGELAGT